MQVISVRVCQHSFVQVNLRNSEKGWSCMRVKKCRGTYLSTVKLLETPYDTDRELLAEVLMLNREKKGEVETRCDRIWSIEAVRRRKGRELRQQSKSNDFIIAWRRGLRCPVLGDPLVWPLNFGYQSEYSLAERQMQSHKGEPFKAVEQMV
jgi:hypothetical protein